ncbi:hypothetical protein CYMTET_56340 [Cymbomonas tetramitiformis]|uniref:3-hydroxybutyryl-CoA dehydrogenase n=1 Tax=Cymbomonas tetramitiformis TaxID=36881 RepID=A0AAE0BCD3_9CHLO|nr:hypothetical protein CYMTET_56340 [Cymbomonas tetramitiformis]
MDIKVVGVVGSGIMGSGIAQTFALAKLDVVLLDISQEMLQKALKVVRTSVQSMVKRGKLKEEELEAALRRITTTVSYADLARADVIIEVVSENLEIKKKVFNAIDEVAGPNCIISSNTSSISITKLASMIPRRSAKFVGLHFFNPVPAMKLVEVIRGLQTGDDAFNAMMQLAERAGKVPVSCTDSPGFVCNRILIPMINEAAFAVFEGVATPKDVDQVMKLGANHKMGPLALADLIGMDTVLSVMQVLHRDFGDPKYRPCPLFNKMVDAGHLGRKSGKGFFEYKPTAKM